MRSTTGKTYEVVVWATGGVGRYAIRTAADRPTLNSLGHGFTRRVTEIVYTPAGPDVVGEIAAFAQAFHGSDVSV
jgi:hypothetical protein